MEGILQTAGYIIGGLIVLILIILILREVACWYWKINKRIDLQQTEIKLLTEIQKSLQQLSNGERAVSGTSPEQIVERVISDRICKQCSFENKPDDMFCSNCGNKL